MSPYTRLKARLIAHLYARMLRARPAHHKGPAAIIYIRALAYVTDIHCRAIVKTAPYWRAKIARDAEREAQR